MAPEVSAGAMGLAALARYFTRLSLIAFGGPAVHITMMEEHFVRRHRLVDQGQFLDFLGTSNLLPGPSSTQLAMLLGRHLQGWRGLMVVGVCFTLPAALFTLALAWALGVWGGLPWVRSAFLGLQPVIVAIILHAVLVLGRTAIKSWDLALLGLGALAADLAGAPVLAVLLGTGVLHWMWRLPSQARVHSSLLAITPVAASLPAAVPAFSLDGLFWMFLRTGAFIYGGGALLFSFLQDDLVERLHWLTQAQLIDAIAIGQMTPGPVFTTATYVGYQLGGLAGAAVATVGIFLPAFVTVALAGRWVPWLRSSPQASAVLDGVIVAALACMLGVGLQLGLASIHGPLGLMVVLGVFLALLAKVPALALLGLGALVGALVL